MNANILSNPVIADFIDLAVQNPWLVEDFFESSDNSLNTPNSRCCSIVNEDISINCCIDTDNAPVTSSKRSARCSVQSPNILYDTDSFSFRDSQKIYSRFISNCRELAKIQKYPNSSKYKKKQTQIYNELSYVIQESMNVKGNVDLFIAMILSWSESLLRTNYDNFFNRYSIANRSNITIGVEEFPSIDSTRKNDGRLRIYIKAPDSPREYIHFDRKQSFIIYLIYLLDRYKHDTEVEAIDITKYKSLFSRLFEYTYRENGTIEFLNLKRKVTHGSQRPVQLKDCLSDIRKNIEKTFNSLGLKEDRLPFIIPGENSHLTIRAKNIVLPSSLSTIYDNPPASL